MPLAEFLGTTEFNRIGEIPLRLVSYVRISQAAQKVNHVLPADLHGHHQALTSA